MSILMLEKQCNLAILQYIFKWHLSASGLAIISYIKNEFMVVWVMEAKNAKHFQDS